MDLYQSLTGMLEIRITGANLPDTISRLTAADIVLRNTRIVDDLNLDCTVLRRDYAAIRALAERRGDRIAIRGRMGLYWYGRDLLRRPVLLAGLAVILLFFLALPSRVLFVRVEGNETIPTRQILEMAKECGIGFGASRRLVRSEQMKNALLGAIPELQWAGVNTSGCVATISVRERAVVEPADDPQGAYDVVASTGGTVSQITVTRGSAKCQVGQQVSQGEVLVSGYTDCGLCIRAECAEAEVYADTERQMEAVFPSEWAYRREISSQTIKYSLVFGKKEINLSKDSGISGVECVKMRDVNWISLPGGFVLPVAIVTTCETVYETASQTVEEDAAAQSLSDYAQRELNRQMIAGQVLEQQQNISLTDGVYLLEGQYFCREMIGRRRSAIGTEGDAKDE
ncbi:MAG: sporulation protein YqfD [Faecousia sp.]